LHMLLLFQRLMIDIYTTNTSSTVIMHVQLHDSPAERRVLHQGLLLRPICFKENRT
jgi:hypothetical protein